MFIGFYKLFVPEGPSDFLLPITAIAVISTILGIAKVFNEPVNKVFNYVSIIMAPIALLFSTGLLFLISDWNVTSLICISLLLADMSWIAFINKNKLALYAQTSILFVLLQGISSCLITTGPQVLTLFTFLTFLAFLAYRYIRSIRTLLSDLLFSLSGLVCWITAAIQMQDILLQLLHFVALLFYSIINNSSI